MSESIINIEQTSKIGIVQKIKNTFTKLQNYLAMPQVEATNRTYILLAFVAYIFSVAIHAYWFKVYGSMEIFRYNGEFIITSPDGWFWGKGVKDALAGAAGIADGNGAIAALPKIIAVAKLLLPFVSLETLMFYSPVVVSSLSVVPLVLIGRLYSQPLFGFLSAIFVVSLPGFYGRMGFGYFDDDMLTLQMPLWVLFAMLWVARDRGGWRAVGFLGLVSLMYQWWYPKSFSLLAAMTVMLALYTLVFDRRRFGMYLAVAVMLSSITMMPFALRALLIAALALGYELWESRSLRTRVALIVSVVALFTFLGGFEPMMGPVKMYFFRSVADSSDASSLHYFTSLKTVSESMSMSFDKVMQMTAVSKWIFMLAIVSYFIMLVSSFSFSLLSPMLALGLLAVDSGSRFTPYANIAIGISLGFFCALSSRVFFKRVALVKALISVLVALPLLFVFVSKIKEPELQNPSAMTSYDVAVLSTLGSAAKSSIVFSWWDYGYPVMFYSGLNTISDGGRQGGDSSFVESVTLIAPSQAFSAHLYRDIAETGSFDALMKKRNVVSPNILLSAMYQEDYPALPKTKDVYLYLPAKMSQIFPTIAQFGNIDLESGKALVPYFYHSSVAPVSKNNTLDVSGVKVDLTKLEISLYNQNAKISNIIKTSPKGIMRIAPEGLDVIMDTTSSQAVVCSPNMTASTFVQLYFLQNIDERYFQLISYSPYGKIYKLMI